MRRNRQMDRIEKRIPAHEAPLSMQFPIAIFSVLLVACAVLFASQASAQSGLGTWLNTDKKGKIVLWECGSEGLCSKIVWLKDPTDENGRPWRDMLNPDPAKRSRPVIGIDVLEGLKKVGPNTWQGHIYDPEVGKRYYLKYIKIGADKVEIRGCLSSGWPCRTKYWTRTNPIRKAPDIQVAAPRPAPKAKRAVQPPPTLARPAPQPAAPPVQRQASVQPIPPAMAAPRPAPQPVQRQAAVQPPPARQPVQRQAAIQPPPAPQPVQRQAAVQPPPPVTLPAVRPPAARPAAPRSPARAGGQWQGQVANTARAPGQQSPVVTGSVPRPAAVADPGAPGYLVQVTAGQDQGEALQAFGKLQQLYPRLLGGYLPNVQKVNLGPKGVWYRVRVGPMGRRTAAANFCRQLKAAGGDCMIRRQ